MKKHNEFRLGDFITLKRGYDLPSGARTPGKYPIVSSSGITGTHSEFQVEGPGVVTGRYGTLGEVFFIPGPFWPLNTSLYVQNFKGNQPRFVNYYLQTILSASFNDAGAVPGVNRNTLHKLRVARPPKDQKTIAAVLSAYDDLIEVNRRQIELSERIAEQVYREWFVRLRFPGHEGVKVVKRLPSGWYFETASEFFGLVKGKSYAGDEISDDPQHMPFISLKSFNRGGGYREDGLKYYSGRYRDDQVVNQNDVVIALTDMTQDRAIVGRPARMPDFGERGAVISLDAVKLIPHNINNTFLYAYMRHSGFSDFIKEFANGANVLHLKPELITRQKLILPPRPIQDEFASRAKPIYHQADVLTEANKRLRVSRDKLLPRLMSGKLAVQYLEIQLPPSMQEN
jgi:type I restriction enzyme, S subunit